MKSHLGLMEDVPANFECEWFLSKTAESIASTHHRHTYSVGTILAKKMGGSITQRVASGKRGKDEIDWREDTYLITEIECFGAKLCLLESGGEAVVVREGADDLFGWLDEHRKYVLPQS